MTEKLVITRLGSQGEGIAEAAAGAVYVPYALPGETVEVEPWPGHDDRRRLPRVVAASPARTGKGCPHLHLRRCALNMAAGRPRLETRPRHRRWRRLTRRAS
jgi:tRNA/tmRNA/rRNA uracil-C5-methylase (TrmA/RlmC/RlmD family)